MLVVGLTGNIGSGKSTVASLLADRGVTVIDADKLARGAVEPGTPALAEIVARWGPGILEPDGTLNRAKLRGQVFRHMAELDALNLIVHPEVERRRDALLEEARARGERVVVCDIPLLFETNLDQAMDLVLLVDAPRDERLRRLVASRGFTPAVAEAIMATQLSAADRRDRADFVIENDGTLGDLHQRVDDVWRAIERRAAEPSS